MSNESLRNLNLDVIESRALELAVAPQTAMGSLLFHLYRFRLARPVARRVLRLAEGDIMFSPTLRRIYQEYYGVMLGRYTYGPGLKAGVFPSGTRIGAYSSIASGVEILRRNHPTNWVSQHPLFFNSIVGLLDGDLIHALHENPLVIGNDVWIGANAIICPSCRQIGDGAIIAAGSIVTKDVLPYSVIGGNPARLIRKRFPPEIEAAVAASKWWLRPLPEIVENLDLFTQEISNTLLPRFIQAFPPSGGESASFQKIP